jgi:putative oxidoreductase
MQRWSAPLALLGRLLLAYIFVRDGIDDLTRYADVASYMRGAGVSPVLLPLVIVTVLGGGLMVAAGLMARWAAIALAGFCLATALLFHFASADAGEAIQFQKDLAIAGGFLILAAFGPGDWSIDAFLARRASNS